MVQLSATVYIIRGILRSLFHSTTTILYFIIFGQKLFEIQTPKGQSINFAKQENLSAGIFLRIYMIGHMFTTILNVISIFMARKILSAVYKGMFYYSIMMLIDELFDTNRRRNNQSYFGTQVPQHIMDIIDLDQQNHQFKDVIKNLKMFKLTERTMEKLKNSTESKYEFTCSICFDNLKLEDEVIETYCDKEVEYKLDDVVIKKKIPHIFHSKCILVWLGKGHLSCPLCRTQLYQKLIQLNTNFSQRIDQNVRVEQDSHQLRIQYGRDLERDETDLENMDEQALQQQQQQQQQWQLQNLEQQSISIAQAQNNSSQIPRDIHQRESLEIQQQLAQVSINDVNLIVRSNAERVDESSLLMDQDFNDVEERSSANMDVVVK
ncbi:UNKNOWN [Stylonychia lemnae]|uniref:RING-type domain-containing protein n=1 Tax=Stylonychia lemnae TaxID=5949 RepID=A0A078A6B8_STYLE|nr:UNKNOWN [Stylonychia lemnae]|eukprot:CDW77120.1 UNKNOWN [Stylonychia lemnae]